MHYFCLDIEIDPNKDYVEGEVVKLKIVLQPGTTTLVEAKLVRVVKDNSFAKLYFEYNDPNDINLTAYSIIRICFEEAGTPNYD